MSGTSGLQIRNGTKSFGDTVNSKEKLSDLLDFIFLYSGLGYQVEASGL